MRLETKEIIKSGEELKKEKKRDRVNLDRIEGRKKENRRMK